MRNAVGDFRVLQKSNDDAKETKDPSGGNQAAGIESAGSGFDEHADKAAREHGTSGGDGKIGAGGKSQRAHAENLHRDHQSNAHENETPGQTLIEDAINHGGHQARLRSRSLVAADALRPLKLDPF